MKKKASLVPINVKDDQSVFSGMIYVNPNQQIFELPEHCFPIYVRINSNIISCDVSASIPMDRVGMSKKLREFLYANLSDPISFNLYEQPQDGYLQQLELKLQFAFQNDQQTIQIQDKQLQLQIKQMHSQKYFVKDFCIPFKFQGVILYLKTIEIQCQQNDYLRNYKLKNSTKITFKAKEGQKIKLQSQKNKGKGLFSHNFKIEEMGIGGLDIQLTNIFRRAFASRRFPQAMIQKFGIQHVKGILLYGPPGTGKTLIARQLAKSLKAKQIKIVNGPQIFSKYVGQSQQNIRKLFANARQDQKKFGFQSPLHIIVFDQMDAICKQRGTINNGTNSQDLVVNQLLTNIDGVQALNNIIVIGMTNRKDLIDQAVLRPGRFEVHIQVGLPNQQGRQQILKIHTKSLSDNSLLGSTVKLENLAKSCKNFTGAQIQALVKSASSFSMTKHSNLLDFSKQLVIKQDTKVEIQDFEKALQQIKPQFGVDQQKFDVFLRGKLYNYGPRYNKIQKTLEASIKMCQKGESQLKSILLHGPKGTGKTSIASYFARNCPFPFVKLISPQQFVGVSQFAKINSIVKIFEDAYRSKQACIILDNIERLIQFVDIGPRFSNQVLQTLLILLKKIPKKSECRLLIIGTTSSYQKLSFLEICKSFNLRLNVPQLNQSQITQILYQFKVDEILSQSIGRLINKISIKKLLQIKDVSIGKDFQKWQQVYNQFI